MQHYNSDWRHVESGIETLTNKTDMHGDDSRLSVYETNAVMRGITTAEMKERNLIGSTGHQLCTIKYDGVQFAIRFHQQVTSNPLELDPAGPTDAPHDQATNIRQLAPVLAPVLDRIDTALDVVSYDFAGVEAASIGQQGMLTDWEFEYEVISTEP